MLVTPTCGHMLQPTATKRDTAIVQRSRWRQRRHSSNNGTRTIHTAAQALPRSRRGTLRALWWLPTTRRREPQIGQPGKHLVHHPSHSRWQARAPAPGSSSPAPLAHYRSAKVQCGRKGCVGYRNHPPQNEAALPARRGDVGWAFAPPKPVIFKRRRNPNTTAACSPHPARTDADATIAANIHTIA